MILPTALNRKMALRRMRPDRAVHAWQVEFMTDPPIKAKCEEVET
jgi:hypothetical protein